METAVWFGGWALCAVLSTVLGTMEITDESDGEGRVMVAVLSTLFAPVALLIVSSMTIASAVRAAYRRRAERQRDIDDVLREAGL